MHNEKEYQEFKFDNKKHAILKQKKIEQECGYKSPLFVVNEFRQNRFIVIQPNNITKEAI